jgi:transcriptional regulator with XRE-family HTH domain
MLVKFAGHDPEEGRPGRPRGPVRTACPILRELFRIAEDVKGWTGDQIAAGLDTYPSKISEWRLGKSNPNMFVYLEFAKLLGVEIRVLGAKR